MAHTASRVLSIALLLSAVLPAGTGVGAAPPPVLTVTATTFPVGLALNVTPDPLGLQRLVWAPAVDFDAKLQPYAVLAARVPTLQNGDVRVIGGGMQVTLHLKPNLRFSDGSPLVAADLAFGLRVNLDPAIGNSFGLDEISQYSTPDDQTLVLQFHDLYGAYLAYALPPALPEHYLEQKYGTTDIHRIAASLATDPYDGPRDVFSGPYRVRENAPGQRLTFEPNPYFTALASPAGIMQRPAIRFALLSSDQSALAQALHSGDTGVDLALGFGPATLSALQGVQRAGFAIRVLPALSVEHLELNMAVPALRDLRVRQALQAAIDKRALVRAVFPDSVDTSGLVASSLLPVASPYHDRSLAVSAYDPALARWLLQSAGYASTRAGPGKHLRLTLTAPDDPTRQREADLLVQAWSVIGVQVGEHLVSASPDDLGGFYAPYDRSGVLTTRSFDLALFDLHLGPDPASLASLFDPDRVPSSISRGALRRNYTGIDNEALAQLPETAQASFDPRSRTLGYDRLQAKVNQILPYIVLFDAPQIVVENGAIRHFAPGPQDGGIFNGAWAWTRAPGNR